MSKTYLGLSVNEIAQGLREGTWTSTEVVQGYIDRLEKLNPLLNAMVQDRFTVALAEAKAADEKLRFGGKDLPPFLGVPCTIKECFAVSGMPNTAGVVARKGLIAEEDADAVRLLKQAGFIILGVTNTSELCIWMESTNLVYGRTNNPYDLGRTAGGSSGGEGALVGSGASPMGLGSDVGGSIRMPAFFNGVFGHKCSSHLVSNVGQYPIAKGDGAAFLSTGPLCRKAQDLMPMMRVLSENHPSLEKETCAIDELKVYTIASRDLPWTSKALIRAQERVVEALVRDGATHEEIEAPDFRKSVEIWSCMMHDGNKERFGDLLLKGETLELTRKFGAWATGRGEHTFATLITLLGEKIVPLVPWEDVDGNIDKGNALRTRLNERIGEKGVLLHPPHASLAKRHNAPLFPPFQWANTAIFNVLGFPVTQVPLGLSSNGVPEGIQVVGALGQDALTIRVAEHLERVFGGWVPPSLLTDIAD